MLHTNRIRTLWVFGILLGLAAALLAWFAVRGVVNGSQPTPSDIGADIAGAQLQPTSLKGSAISESQARAAAVHDFMRGDGYPAGIGVEQKLTVKSAPALYSGPVGWGKEPPAQNRPVWVVVLTNLPFSGGIGASDAPNLPPSLLDQICNGTNTEQVFAISRDVCNATSSSNNPYPHELTLAVDAATGAVIRGDESGQGISDPSWDSINATAAAINRAKAGPQPTSTPAPTATPAPIPAGTASG